MSDKVHYTAMMNVLAYISIAAAMINAFSLFG